ncbi:MAG TPA: tetratricopeptide repeat protein [Vicinamibacterales bacterium]|nr:tetratricopeptide repeat protein [Vicinamibacterales bacterium]
MRRLWVLLSVTGLLAGALAYLQHLDRDRQFRQLLDQGERALFADQGYAAIEAFSGAIALRPSSMAAWYRRGDAYRVQRRYDEALRDLRAANRLAPDAPQPLIAIGALFDERGDRAQAAEWYGRAATLLRDEDPAVLYALALARFRAGFPAEAIDPLRRAIVRQPSQAAAHYLLGLVLRDAQNPDGAIAALEQAVRLSPTLTPAREELADLYRERGRPVDELLQLQALSTADPDPARRVAIALAETRRGQFDAALGTLNEAATRQPADAGVQMAIARVYLARAERGGDRSGVTRALVVLERALGANAPRSEGLALYGRALFLTGDLANAERILQEATTTSPIDLEAFAFLADAAVRLDHPAVARDALVDLDALEGDTATASVREARARRIAVLSLDAGDPRTALDHLSRIVAGGHADAATMGMVARARWQIGDAEGAREALGRAIALDARDAEVQRLRRTIK